MTVLEFEKKVLEVERLMLIVRLPRSTNVGNFTFLDGIKGTETVAKWAELRLFPSVGRVEFEIVDALGQLVQENSAVHSARHAT